MSGATVDPYRRWRTALFWVSVPLGGGALLVVLALVAHLVAQAEASSSQASGSTGTFDLTSYAHAQANVTAPDAPDAAGTTVSYRADNLVDQVPTTAWRAEGDGSQVVITLTLPEPAALSAVGLVPGYAKTDPVDGADRFWQNSRVTAVRWIFDDGSFVDQPFRESRLMQQATVSVVTRSVQLRILGTVPGDPLFNFVAISDVLLVGSF